MKKIQLFIILFLMISCIYDPMGVHRFIVVNNLTDTFELKCFKDNKDSSIILSPKDSIKIFEGVNNSKFYTRETEDKILHTFDSIVVINKVTNNRQNIIEYKFWDLKIVSEAEVKIGESYFTIR